METKNQIVLALVALLLLAAAWLIEGASLWSRIGNYTVPWFLSALAVALLMVLAVCGLRDQSPADLPIWVVLCTVFIPAAILFGGLEVDHQKYFASNSIGGSRAEVLGLLVILTGLFLVVRGKRSPSP